jgi:hypothetical protein
MPDAIELVIKQAELQMKYRLYETPRDRSFMPLAADGGARYGE